jgi:16S rRNA (adenine1518-N6/adenine1519-N6)-dimethyltransferase
MAVRPKKSLGQHFLRDENIARKIVGSLDLSPEVPLLEIGPGMGVLTKYLFDSGRELKVIEIDRDAHEHLRLRFPGKDARLILADFLDYDLEGIFSRTYALIGNFPYNISSQIFFRVLEYRQDIVQVVCMIQREVAERLKAGPGSKTYGILSVLLQTYYHIDLLFHVPPTVFSPPPRVQSSVIRLARNERRDLPCSDHLFFRTVKTAFNQRRKILRNSLKEKFDTSAIDEQVLKRRPEELGVEEFIDLATGLAGDKSV